MRQPQVRCVEFVEQITEWLEGGLSDPERLLFEEHLAYCGPCGRYVDQFRATLRLLRDSDQPLGDAPPQPLRDSLLNAFRQQHR
ncbi:MAG TPA: zf-HC2 domain-containing protein [Acidimicrobiales bacterium]